MIYIEWRPFWRQKVKMAPNIKNGAKSQFLVEIFKINKKAAETVLPTSQCVLSGYRAPASPAPRPFPSPFFQWK